MNELKNWVAVENNIVVHGGFQASQEYIDSYNEEIVNREDKVTPEWYNDKVYFVDVTELDPRPTTGWTITGQGHFVAPIPPEPTKEELEIRAAEEIAESQRKNDISRVAELRKKVGPGKPGLSQAERDELNLIIASFNL